MSTTIAYFDRYPGNARIKTLWMAFPLGFHPDSPGKWYHPSHHQERSESPWAYVLLSLFWLWLMLVSPCPPCPPCSASSGLMPLRLPLMHASHRCSSHPQFWRGRIRSISVYGLRQICGHPTPAAPCFHPHPWHHWQDWNSCHHPAVCVVFPVPLSYKALPFCHSNVLSHSYCLLPRCNAVSLCQHSPTASMAS